MGCGGGELKTSYIGLTRYNIPIGNYPQDDDNKVSAM